MLYGQVINWSLQISRKSSLSSCWMLSLMTPPPFQCWSYVKTPILGPSQPLIINRILYVTLNPLSNYSWLFLNTAWHLIESQKELLALQRRKEGKTRGTDELGGRIQTMWANKSLCVTGTSYTPPFFIAGEDLFPCIMLPPLNLHLHPASVVFCMHILLHFFELKKEPG